MIGWKEKKYTEKTETGFVDFKCPKCGKLIKKIDMKGSNRFTLSGVCQYCDTKFEAELINPTEKTKTQLKGYLYNKIARCKKCNTPIKLSKKIFSYHKLCDSCYKEMLKEKEKQRAMMEDVAKAKKIIKKDVIFKHFSKIFSEEEVLDVLIKNDFDLMESIDFLDKKIMKEKKELAIEQEISKMEELDEKMKIREEAEKRLYGKVERGRKILTEEEKEMIFN